MFFLRIFLQKNDLAYIRLVQVTENYHRQKLFSPLTKKNISWNLRHNKNILRLRTLLVFIKITVGALDEIENPSNIKNQKVKM